MPKIESLKTDLTCRKIDVAFLQEIWENRENQQHSLQVERMLELNGLKYFSTPRPLSSKGYAYGGAAIVVNILKFKPKRVRSSLGPP